MCLLVLSLKVFFFLIYCCSFITCNFKFLLKYSSLISTSTFTRTSFYTGIDMFMFTVLNVKSCPTSVQQRLQPACSRLSFHPFSSQSSQTSPPGRPVSGGAGGALFCTSPLTRRQLSRRCCAFPTSWAAHPGGGSTLWRRCADQGVCQTDYSVFNVEQTHDPSHLFICRLKEPVSPCPLTSLKHNAACR